MIQCDREPTTIDGFQKKLTIGNYIGSKNVDFMSILVHLLVTVIHIFAFYLMINVL